MSVTASPWLEHEQAYQEQKQKEVKQHQKDLERTKRLNQREKYHTADLKYIYTAPKPEKIIDVYADDLAFNGVPQLNLATGSWYTGSLWRNNMSEEQRTAGAVEMQKWLANSNPTFRRNVDLIERAYYQHRGDIPLGWWSRLDPHDIQMLIDIYPKVGEDEDLAAYLYSVGETMSRQTQWDQQVEAEIQRRFEAEMRSRGLFGTTTQVLGPGGLAWDTIGKMVDLKFSDAWEQARDFSVDLDKTPEQIRAEVEEAVLKEFRDGIVEPQEELPWIARMGMNAMGFIMNDFQVSMDSAVKEIGNLTATFGWNWYDEALRMHEEELEASIYEIERMRVTAKPEVVEQYRFTAVQDAWRDMETQFPEEYKTYLDMAGGDQAMAMGFFGADIEEELMASEQMQMLLEEEEEDYQAYVQHLEEADYRPSATLMEALAAYGTHVPMRLASAITLLLTDDDVTTDVISGKWETLWEEVEKNEYSPAKVLGLDGTAVGLGLDMGAGIAFDPTTWIFGPRATAMLGRASHTNQVRKMANSSIVRRTIRDIRRLRASNASGSLEVVMAASWLDEVGLLPKALELLGIKGKKRLGGSPWRRGDSRTLHTQEIQTSTVRQLLDEVDIDRLDNLDGRVIEDIAASLEKDGFHGAIEIEYSLHDGTFRLADGGKRVRAAEALELDMVPVTVRVRTSARADKMPDIDGLEPTDVQHIADIAQGNVKSTIRMSANEELAAAMAQDFEVFGQARPRVRLGDGGYDVLEAPNLPEGMELRVIDQSDASVYYIVDKDGNVVAGAMKTGLEGVIPDQLNLDVWTRGSHRGQKLQNSIFDAARARGDELLVASGRSGALSQAGEANAVAQAKRFFKEKGIDPDTLPGPMGRKLEDIIDLEKGEKVPRHSRRASSYEPNVKDNTYVRPDKLLPERLVYGEFDEPAMQKLIEEALNRGATMPSATRLATAMGWSTSLKKMARSTLGKKTLGWIERYASPQSKITRLDLHGPTSIARINETVIRVWGQDTAKADQWLGQILEHLEKEAARSAQYADELARLNLLRSQRDALDDVLGGGWDDAYRQIEADLADDVVDITDDVPGPFDDDFHRGVHDPADDTVVDITDDVPGPFDDDFHEGVFDTDDLDPIDRLEAELTPEEIADMERTMGMASERATRAREEMAQARENRRQAQEQRDALEAEFVDGITRLDAEMRMDRAELATIIEEMFDDYNRTHIATNPAWKGHVDPETGMVPWDDLKAGRPKPANEGVQHEGSRRILSEEQVEAARAREIENPEKLAQFLSNLSDQKMGVDLPMSPLDMVIASEVGGAAYRRITQASVAHGLRESLRTFHLWWVVDKVLSPATAVTVSMDELMRIFHYGGAPAMMRWAGDKAILGAARVAALRHGKWNPRYGMEHLPKRAQQRIQALQDYPTYLKQAERQAFEGMGLGYTDLAPDDPGYLDAAHRWLAGWMQDSGFRAFLRGEEAFTEWFFGPEGQRMRQATVMDRGQSRLMSGADEAYQGYQTLLDHVILNEAGPMKGDMLKAFKETATKIDELGGGRAVEPPNWVFNHLGTIRGVQKQAPHKLGMTRFTDAYFDKLFMNPVNYRRGVIADLVRTTETKRLERLFLSQGKKIVPDTELERVLGLQGLGGGATHGQMRTLLQERAFQQGYVTRGYIDDLVEHRVVSEIDNMLFTWDMGSRMGKQSQMIFPFGRPWADMMGFWGREVFARPALRGWVAKTPVIGDVAQAAVDRLAFNPKPLATWSRLAGTDFRMDSLWPGADLPGEEVDFSPLFFMPVKGDNPFASLLPGLGIVPLWAVDQLVMNMYDPVENPVEYEQLMQSVGDFIPAVAYQRGGNTARLLGGGSTGAATELLTDIFGATTGRPYFNLTSELGDIGREINRSRELSALMADPEEVEALMKLEDPDAIRLFLEGLAHEADKRASKSHGLETLLRKSMPATWDFDESLDQIHTVWIDAAKQHGQVLGLPRDWKPADPNDPEALRQQANDVRSAFFNLEQWQRDMLIVQNPELAVNLVSSWEYTPLGIATLGTETAEAYRTDGTRASGARHRLYVDRGYIRPIEPITRVMRIVGLQQASKDSLAKQVYEQTASYVNDALWEQRVSEETKATLQSIADSPFGKERGFQTAHEVWMSWSTVEEELELAVAAERGIDPESPEFETIKERVKVPSKEKPWGQTWTGIGGESERFGNLAFNELPAEVNQMAEALGMELIPGVTGTELMDEIAGKLTEIDSMVFQIVQPAYDDYIGNRSVGKAAWEATLRKQAGNPSLHEEWRTSLNSFLQNAARAEKRSFEGNLPLSEAQAIVDQYQALRATASKSLRIDWEGAWEGRYQRTFGPLEWTPPEPPSPILEDGTQSPNAYQPYIQRIVDGDTLIVSDKAGPSFFWHSMDEGKPRMKSVRLLGVASRELGSEGGLEDRNRLVQFLTQARNSDRPIYLVRDPETFGTSTDVYGRELAWLIVGDEPFYFPEELDRSISEGAK